MNGLHSSKSEDSEEGRNRAEQGRRRRGLLIASVVFLLGYVVLLVGVYFLLGGSPTYGKEEVCDEEPQAKLTSPRFTKTLLVQVIREASNPFDFYSTSRPGLSDRGEFFVPEKEEATRQQSSQERKKAESYKKIAFPLAHARSPALSSETILTLHEFRDRVLMHIPDLHERADKLHWGGSHVPWWMPPLPHSAEAVDHFEGGRLLWYYYKIMRPYITDGLADRIFFPLRLCKRAGGCSAEDAIAHSLEFRETYQPWRITPSMRRENQNGFVFTRGFSPPAMGTHNYGRHAMVWFRLGLHKVDDSLMYMRVIMHSLDRAVAASLHESNYRVGKFNVLFDGTAFEFNKVPDFAHGKSRSERWLSLLCFRAIIPQLLFCFSSSSPAYRYNIARPL